MSNIWLEPLPPRAYLLPCNLSYILSPLPWHTSQLEASFSLHILFSVDLSLRVSLGIFLPFPISFFELIVLHVDGFFLFFFNLSKFDLSCCVSCVQQSDSTLHIHVFVHPLRSVVKESPCNEGDLGSIPGLGRYAQMDMTSLPSMLAWRISWTEEPSRLQSTGSQRVGHM